MSEKANLFDDISFDNDENDSEKDSALDKKGRESEVGKVEILEPVEDIICDDPEDSELVDSSSILIGDNSVISSETATTEATSSESTSGKNPAKTLNNPPVELDRNGKQILRDERGRILPGSGGLNFNGPLSPFKQKLKDEYGEDSAKILKELDKIAFYDQIKMRHKWAHFKGSDKLKALEMLINYAEGKPTQSIEASVEQKVIQVNVDISRDDELDGIN